MSKVPSGCSCPYRYGATFDFVNSKTRPNHKPYGNKGAAKEHVVGLSADNHLHVITGYGGELQSGGTVAHGISPRLSS